MNISTNIGNESKVALGSVDTLDNISTNVEMLTKVEQRLHVG